MDDFTELDAAARANLSEQGVRRFHTYKADLLRAATSREDLELILRGWIWDEIEAENPAPDED